MHKNMHKIFKRRGEKKEVISLMDRAGQFWKILLHVEDNFANMFE